jgi:hypothetical protein
MDLTGDVRFIDAFRLGFTVLDEFRLSAVFLDENGRVLESKGLLTNRGSLDDIPFHVTLRPPSSAVSMAFSYAGKAHEGGRDSGAGSLTSFWFDPVNLPGS